MKFRPVSPTQIHGGLNVCAPHPLV